MKNHHWKWIFILLSILFATLFYEQLVGINFLLFDFTIVFLALLKFKPKIGFNVFTLLLLSNLLMALIVVLNGSFVSKTMGWIALILFLGNILFPSMQSILKIIGTYFANVIIGYVQLFAPNPNPSKRFNFGFLRFIKITFIPIIILVIFSIFYKSSNPIFNEYFNAFFEKIANFTKNINIKFVFLILLGSIFSIILILNKLNKWNTLYELDSSSKDELFRIRKKSFFSSFIALKMEYKSALVLFIGLNLLILFFNITDVLHLWINFNWDGGFLKAFVHEGTYLLIISVVLSIIVTLIYFRKNLNFIQNNQFLKILAIVWLSQNIFMLISVGIRNYHYINHFALAYKRIGVYFFLAICAVGLITCILKVWKRKSFYYLERTNALSVYLFLILMACVNWDIVIAKYNFAHYNKSFLHLPYMLKLSNKALPYLDYSEKQIREMDSIQHKLFKYEARGYYRKINYIDRVSKRKKLFVQSYEKRHWLSWNYADYKAYTLLKKN